MKSNCLQTKGFVVVTMSETNRALYQAILYHFFNKMSNVCV